MHKYLLIAFFCWAGCAATSQTKNTVSDSLGNLQISSGGIALNRLGVCAIKLKDGTKLINCTIKEIKPLYVSYVKGRTMHDLMIDKIRCIVPENENFVIWFDGKNKAIEGWGCP